MNINKRYPYRGGCSHRWGRRGGVREGRQRFQHHLQCTGAWQGVKLSVVPHHQRWVWVLMLCHVAHKLPTWRRYVRCGHRAQNV